MITSNQGIDTMPITFGERLPLVWDGQNRQGWAKFRFADIDSDKTLQIGPHNIPLRDVFITALDSPRQIYMPEPGDELALSTRVSDMRAQSAKFTYPIKRKRLPGHKMASTVGTIWYDPNSPHSADPLVLTGDDIIREQPLLARIALHILYGLGKSSDPYGGAWM